MHKRIVELVDNGLVNLGVLALEYEFNVLAQFYLHIADDTGHFIERARNGNHSHGHYSVLKLAVEFSELSCGLLEIIQLQTLEVGIGGYHSFCNNYLSYQIKEYVKLVEVYGNKRLLYAALCRACCTVVGSGLGSFRFLCSRLGSLRFLCGGRLCAWSCLSGLRGSLNRRGVLGSRSCGSLFGRFLHHI